MPIWLLLPLLALVGVAAVKVVSSASSSDCVEPGAPPPNPFFDAEAKAIDWDKLQKAWGKVYATDKKTMSALTAAKNAAAAFGGAYGIVAYAVITMAQEFATWLAGDDNSNDWKGKAQDGAATLVSMGFLPPLPWKGASFRTLNNTYASTIVGIETREPYVQWLIKQGGAAFEKWGGVPEVMKLGATFVVGDNATTGSCPTAAPDVSANVERLRLAALAIACEFGILCSGGSAVVEAALAANEAYKHIFSWKLALQDPSRCLGARNVIHTGIGVRYDGTPSADDPDPCKDNAHGFVLVEHLVPFYGYAAGIHAALTKAAELTKRPLPPPIAATTVRYDPSSKEMEAAAATARIAVTTTATAAPDAGASANFVASSAVASPAAPAPSAQIVASSAVVTAGTALGRRRPILPR